MSSKEEIMSRCIELAYGAKGQTKTNPLVGACVKHDGKLFYGIHEKYGSWHAEVNAINKADKYAEGSELFVTLEPCSTHGKTPPCVDKIISSGIKKVYVGVLDPNPKHAGRGINILRKAGIDVEYGIISEESGLLIEDFIKYQKYNLPYVTLKMAVSADGKTSANTGDSKWITCEKSREMVHKMRSQSDCVLTGIGTVLADNPLLTDRRSESVKQPVRAVLDTFCKIPLSSNLVKTANIGRVLLYTSENVDKNKIKELELSGVEVIKVKLSEEGHLDLNEVLSSLYSFGFMNVMVEAGSRINGSFFDNNLVDKLEIFMAPKIIGGEKSSSAVSGKGADYMKDVIEFKSWNVSESGSDIRISARIKDYVSELVDFTKNFTVEQE